MSLDYQVERAKEKLIEDGFDFEEVNKAKVFPIDESGASDVKERISFLDALNFCLNPNNNVKVVALLNIGRLTREGSSYYWQYKKQLSNLGIRIVDVKGIIKPDENLLEHTKLEYKWSVESPSFMQETIEAESYKKQRLDTLVNSVDLSFQYALKGYQHGSSLVGYDNITVYTEDGKRTSRTPNEIEAPWIIKMFQMRAGGYEDERIVEELNKEGFKTRKQFSKDGSYKGGKPLTVKKLQKYIEKTVYAGVKDEVWGDTKKRKVTVKTHYSGLVTPDLFNKANKGKKIITEDTEGNVTVEENKKESIRSKYNPNFPFKNCILCPVCNSPFLGSYSTGKSGKKYAAYHCSRGHKRYAASKKEFERHVLNYLNTIKFSEEEAGDFRKAVFEVHKNKYQNIRTKADRIDEIIKAIELKQQSIKDTLPSVKDVPSLLNDYLTDYTGLENRKKKLREDVNALLDEEMEIAKLVKYTEALMEHPAKFVLETPNSREKVRIFSLLFEKLPTYEEILNGTPRLNPIFKLKEEYAEQKVNMVGRVGIEPT